MSGSTENLLKHSHLGESSDSIDKIYTNNVPSKTKPAQNDGSQGIVNQGFVGEQKHHDTPEEIYGRPAESLHSLSNKRATSFQEKTVPPRSRSRRHSSPEPYGDFATHEKPRKRQSLGKHRLMSASEEDLRRKAVLNSMKAERKFQSVSHLPSSGQENEANSNLKQPNTTSKANIRDDLTTKDAGSIAILDNSKNSAPIPPREKIKDPQMIQANVIALEKAQLDQYKRRLTLALDERAKLTEKLQLLSSSLSRQNLQNESTASSPRSTLSLYSPRQDLSSFNHPRQSLQLITVNSPREAMRTGEEGRRSLPVLPTKTGKKAALGNDERMKVNEKLADSEEIENSRESEPTYLSRIVDAENQMDNSEGNLETVPRKKENLSKASEEMWQKHLSGEEIISPEKDNKTAKNSDKPVKDENNNSKKPMTVEQFLRNENDQENQQDFDENDREIRRVLEKASRHSPEIYEPLLRYQTEKEKGKKSSQNEKNHQSPRNAVKHRKDDIQEKKRYENEDYEVLRTSNNSRRNEYENMSLEKHDKRNPHQHDHYTGLQNKRLYNYMTPPGTTNSSQGSRQTIVPGRGESATSAPERAPSNISDKLRYYKGVMDDRNEADQEATDLADAYANEKSPERKMEIQQLAAAKAALLRREASALLYEAMNLERLCDPNARVRHIYLP